MNPMVNNDVLYLAAGVILILLALIAALRYRALNGKAQWLSDLDNDRDVRERGDRWITFDEAQKAQRLLEDLRKSTAAAYRPTKVTRLRDYSRGPH